MDDMDREPLVGLLLLFLSEIFFYIPHLLRLPWLTVISIKQLSKEYTCGNVFWHVLVKDSMKWIFETNATMSKLWKLLYYVCDSDTYRQHVSLCIHSTDYCVNHVVYFERLALFLYFVFCRTYLDFGVLLSSLISAYTWPVDYCTFCH